jgi:hypothetical protein
MLGAQPVLGRGFVPDDEVDGTGGVCQGAMQWW